MQGEIKLLSRKRKPPNENTKDSTDESTHNKKSKSRSDTNSDEHYFKSFTNFNIEEPIEDFNEKNYASILVPEEEFAMDKYILKKINNLEEEMNINSFESKNCLNFRNFLERNEYDMFPLVPMKYALDKLLDFSVFKEDYTYYIYNNLKPLLNDKQFIEANKNIVGNKDNELFFKEFNDFSNYRWTKYIESTEKYNINLQPQDKDLINHEQNRKQNSKDKCDVSKANDTYKNSLKEYQLEPFIAALVYNSKKKYEQRERDEQKNIYDKNSIIKDSLEIQNFNLNDIAMISVITGIKYNKNIVEINLCGNSLSSKSCFWIGTCLKTLPYLSILDMSQCNLDNDKLYMFYEGTRFYRDEKLNEEQFNLSKLNLKDNPNITDNNLKNSNYEHPLALILEKCKLKIFNLTNAKIGGNGAMKLFKIMDVLLEKNKLDLENLVLINNNIQNEECLNQLGNFLEKKNCPLKKLILSKNFISTSPPGEVPHPNYFKMLMKSIEKSQILELFLLNCNLGNDVDDLNIIYEMLKNNKSLTSIRLFGNKICEMNFFSKILGIFSDYNKPLENNTLKNLDLSKNNVNIKIDDNFMKIIENLKLKYLDINQNYMKDDEKEIFMKKTNELQNIRIIY